MIGDVVMLFFIEIGNIGDGGLKMDEVGIVRNECNFRYIIFE